MKLILLFNLFILVFASAVNADDKTISEREFLDIIRTLEKSYTDFVKNNYQATLVFEKKWADETVNAQATQALEDLNKIWRIHVPGGMARAAGMTKDAFALVLCHELGHHIGGAPHTFLYDGWPSAEGQADYWATSKCLKKYFNERQSDSLPPMDLIPDAVVDDCSNAYREKKDQKICIKTLLASMDFGNFLNLLATPKIVVQFTTQDWHVVRGTNFNDYPRPQCRFDTLYQGALCPISFSQLTSDTDPTVASCTSYEIPGARPLCWFFPEQ